MGTRNKHTGPKKWSEITLARKAKQDAKEQRRQQKRVFPAKDFKTWAPERQTKYLENSRQRPQTKGMSRKEERDFRKKKSRLD